MADSVCREEKFKKQAFAAVRRSGLPLRIQEEAGVPLKSFLCGSSPGLADLTLINSEFQGALIKGMRSCLIVM